MDNYLIDYTDKKEFEELEEALKKYDVLTYKKLQECYPNLKNGNFIGELTKEDKNAKTKTYEFRLISDGKFGLVYNTKLIYTVYENRRVIMLNSITPKDILLEKNKDKLTTYKGVVLYKKSRDTSKNMYKIDLLDMLKFSSNSKKSDF
jgi:hypothetical protein